MDQASPLSILLLDTKVRNVNHYICLAIRNALAASGVEVVYARYDDAIRRATEKECDIFLAFDGEEMHLDVCQRLASLTNFSVLWLTEDPYETPSNLAASKMFDLVYTNDRGSAHHYENKGSALPLAGSKKYHYHSILDEGSELLRYDLFFLGAAWPNRVEFLNRLLPRICDLKVKVGLSPVGDHKIHLPLAENAYRWRTSPADCAALANRSRITLALHREFTTNPGGSALATTPPPRLFEVALAGSMQLYDEMLSETSQYFIPGNEIVPYSSVTDCEEKIRYYLGNPEIRRSIASAAQSRALRDHTYEARVSRLLEDVNRLRRSRKRKAKERSGRRRLLFVTHNIRPAGNFGGVEVYQECVASKLDEKCDVYFYYRDQRKGPNTYVLTDGKYSSLEEIVFDGEYQPWALSVSAKESAFARILQLYRIDLIHYHHLIGHPPSLVHISKLLNIPSVATLQDFWVLCDSHNLLDYRRRYCSIHNQPDIVCDICTDARTGKADGSQAIRRNFFRRVLAAADIVVANTAGYEKLVNRFFPDTTGSGRIRAIPLPVPDSSVVRNAHAPRQKNARDLKLRVAILGNFTYEKGAETIVHALTVC